MAKGIVSSTITGDKGLDQALKKFPIAFVNKAVKVRLREAMKLIVLPHAQRNTPVSGTKRGTGRGHAVGQLKRSLTVRTAQNNNGGRLARDKVGFAVVPAKTKTRDAYYAKWVFLNARNRQGSGKLKRADSLGKRGRAKSVASGQTRVGTRTLRNALYKNSRALRRFVIAMLKKDLPQITRDVAAAGIARADAKAKKLAAELG